MYPRRHALLVVCGCAVSLTSMPLAAQEQQPPASAPPAGAPAVALPPVTVEAQQKSAAKPKAKAKAKTSSAPAITPSKPEPAPVAAAVNPNSTMTPPPAYSGGQVATGGQVGLLGNKGVMDTPFNQTSYTDKLIQDQQSQTLADVLDNDPSVRSNFPSSAGVEDFNIRGFPISNADILFGGLYGVAPGYGGAIDTGAIARVEVLKGPNAFLYGIGPGSGVGGAINLVPKRASETPITQFTTSYSSDAQFGGHVDIGRRYGERDGDSVGVRFNGVVRGGETAIDRTTQETKSAALGLDFRGTFVRLSTDLGYQSMRTEAMRRFIYLDVWTNPDVKIPAAPDSSSNWSQPWTFLDNESVYGVVRGEVDIVEDVTAYAAVGGTYNENETVRQTLGLTDDHGTLSGRALNGVGSYRSGTAETGLRGSAATAFIKHDFNVAYTTYWRTIDDASTTAWPASDNNLYDPVFSPRPDFDALPDASDAPKISAQRNASVAFSDTLSVLDERVQLTVGVRRQQVVAKNFDLGTVTSSYDESAWTPAYGLVVKAFSNVSIYANHIEGLQQGLTAPDNAANKGQVFPPFVTEQKEVGVKIDFGALTTTLSAFQIALPSAFIGPGNIFSVNGEQRNRGIELNVFGEPIKGFRPLGGVAFIESVLTKTENAAFQGTKGPGVPEVTANIGAEWDTPFVPGLTVTGRMIYTSSAPYDQANSLTIPSWTRFDAGARYTFVTNGIPTTVRANITNLFGNDYWATADQWGSLGLSEPRTFQLATTFDF